MSFVVGLASLTNAGEYIHAALGFATNPSLERSSVSSNGKIESTRARLQKRGSGTLLSEAQKISIEILQRLIRNEDAARPLGSHLSVAQPYTNACDREVLT